MIVYVIVYEKLQDSILITSDNHPAEHPHTAIHYGHSFLDKIC